MICANPCRRWICSARSWPGRQPIRRRCGRSRSSAARSTRCATRSTRCSIFTSWRAAQSDPTWSNCRFMSCCPRLRGSSRAWPRRRASDCASCRQPPWSAATAACSSASSRIWLRTPFATRRPAKSWWAAAVVAPGSRSRFATPASAWRRPNSTSFSRSSIKSAIRPAIVSSGWALAWQSPAPQRNSSAGASPSAPRQAGARPSRSSYPFSAVRPCCPTIAARTAPAPGRPAPRSC